MGPAELSPGRVAERQLGGQQRVAHGPARPGPQVETAAPGARGQPRPEVDLVRGDLERQAGIGGPGVCGGAQVELAGEARGAGVEAELAAGDGEDPIHQPPGRGEVGGGRLVEARASHRHSTGGLQAGQGPGHGAVDLAPGGVETRQETGQHRRRAVRPGREGRGDRAGRDEGDRAADAQPQRTGEERGPLELHLLAGPPRTELERGVAGRRDLRGHAGEAELRHHRGARLRPGDTAELGGAADAARQPRGRDPRGERGRHRELVEGEAQIVRGAELVEPKSAAEIGASRGGGQPQRLDAGLGPVDGRAQGQAAQAEAADGELHAPGLDRGPGGPSPPDGGREGRGDLPARRQARRGIGEQARRESVVEPQRRPPGRRRGDSAGSDDDLSLGRDPTARQPGEEPADGDPGRGLETVVVDPGLVGGHGSAGHGRREPR